MLRWSRHLSLRVNIEIDSDPEPNKEQTAEFSKIKGGQYMTVKGIFNGEARADLKFCKLVKVE